MKTDNSVQTDSAIFLYDQIKIQIRQMIQDGMFKEGQKIPNENELCAMFNASRITIRRALKDLKSEGVLHIIHGKGTYVSRKKKKLHILNLEGFTEGMSNMQNSFTKIVLSKTILTSDERQMTLFERSTPFKILKLVRLIKDADAVFSVDFAYLPLDTFPEIDHHIGNNISTFRLIHNMYHVEFGQAKKEMEVVLPDSTISDYLEISRMEPVIQIKKLIKDTAGIPVHYSRYFLLATSVKFHIDVDINARPTPSFELPDI